MRAGLLGSFWAGITGACIAGARRCLPFCGAYRWQTLYRPGCVAQPCCARGFPQPIQVALLLIDVVVVYQINQGCRRLLWVGQDRIAKTLLRFFRMLGLQPNGHVKRVV